MQAMLPQGSPVPQHIAIIGGGFSGTLLAINLMRHDGPRVTLIERGRAARGLAYATHNASHLLNVRASNMSAFPDMPDHFAHWFAEHGGSADGFASRQLYGQYLAGLLDEASQRHDGLELLQGNALASEVGESGVQINLDTGRLVKADLAVLAVGNLPPHPPAGLDPELLGNRYRSDPWSSDITIGLKSDDRVLLIGTGLTAVDAALTLWDSDFGGTIVALSRRGLLPRPHGPGSHPASDEAPAEISFAKLLNRVRRRTDEIGWRQSIDELRPITQRIWQRADGVQRARFLRHLRPWWDVHRHRLAPQVAARLEEMQAAGKLQIFPGTTVGFIPENDAVRAVLRPRGSAAALQDNFARVINCTGPGGDLLRADEPLLRGLADTGTIRADAARLGIDVDSQCRTLSGEGHANPRLLAVGPLTRGTFWEITAVPDIRRQVWDIARRLSNAHWVSGNL